MYKDYQIVLDILNQSFATIQEIAKERELSFEELQDFFAEILTDVKIYAMDDSKNKENDVIDNADEIATVAANYTIKEMDNIPAVVYGPPQYELPEDMKIEEDEDKYEVRVEANAPAVVYGPPQYDFPEDMKIEEDDDENKYEVEANAPAVVYGPPQYDFPEDMKIEEDEDENKYEVEVEENAPALVYGPPQIEELDKMLNEDARNSSNFMEHGDEYIPGTTIWKPRDRNAHETDEEYVDYLEKYYGEQFPEQAKSTNK